MMWLIALTSTIAFCCHDAVHDIERQRFIGSWELIAASFEGEPINEGTLAPLSGKIGAKVHFNETTYSVADDCWSLHKIGDLPWTIHPWEPSCLYVFWFEGIYEFRDNDELWICVKYHGQGVEGEHAKLWRRPRDFTVSKGQEHAIFGLKRREVQAK